MLQLPVVVIGAGTAGLAVSHHLSSRGVEHVVFDKGQIGETWHSQRWDSFQLNTPNRVNSLPGASFPGDPAGFATTHQLLNFLQQYASSSNLPIREGVAVTGVAVSDGGFEIRAAHPEFAVVTAAAVVVASGAQNRAKTSPVAANLPTGLQQMTAAEYRSAAATAPGPVLVVGSAQSGCQIAEDLLAAGRKVYLGTSRVRRARRRYRGRDMLEWFGITGFLDQRPADLPDPAMMRAAQPQISGVGDRGHTVSLQGLAARGVVLVGRLVGCEGSTLLFDDSVADCVRFGDEGSEQIRGMVDDYLARTGAPADDIEPDPEDVACSDPDRLAGPREIDARSLGAVVWCTGFEGDFSWLDVPGRDTAGRPVHDQGLSATPGLFFMGFPCLRTRRSGIIPGVDGDGGFIADSVVHHLGK